MNRSSALWLCGILAIALVAGCGGSSPRGDDDGGDDMPDAGCTTQKFYRDGDGDRFGDATKAMDACAAPAGYVAQAGDCRDDNAAIHPGVKEVCDQVDNDCNALTDDADPGLDAAGRTTYHRDGDGDGFGDEAMPRAACVAPAGYVADATDCDDGDAAVKPTATEVCDGIDNNCNGLTDLADPGVDPTTAHPFFRDGDGDGFGAGAAMTACSAPSGFVDTPGDCNDADASSHPGGTEVCDGADNDCDGGADGTVAAPNRCAALVGTYAGSYTHQATEHIGATIINQMRCTSTGNASLVLARRPAPLQGTFNCTYTGGLTLFDRDQRATLSASVGLDGTVTGTIDHVYETFDLRRTYSISGTMTPTGLTLSGTGQLLPHPLSASPWDVVFSSSATR